jgi:hypothetical protein
MPRFKPTLTAAALAFGLAPSLAGAQTAPAPAPSHQGPLIINPSLHLAPEQRRPGGLNLDPAPSGGSGLRLGGSEARISPTLTAPTSAELPVTDRPETRVPGFRLKVPW